jgi:hypothetical protein
MIMANAFVNFTHSVLSDITSHLVTINVTKIKNIFEAFVQGIPGDLRSSQAVFAEMNVIYQELGPAMAIAKDIFPELTPVFVLLDAFDALDNKLVSILVPVVAVLPAVPVAVPVSA